MDVTAAAVASGGLADALALGAVDPFLWELRRDWQGQFSLASP